MLRRQYFEEILKSIDYLQFGHRYGAFLPFGRVCVLRLVTIQRAGSLNPCCRHSAACLALLPGSDC